MNLKFDQTGSRAIVYDDDYIQQPEPQLFTAEYWQRQAAVSQTAAGRGNALMLETPDGPWVLRSYLRGGWPARVSRDRYLFTGFARSRPLAEVRMLAKMYDLGLPVPQPVAGLCDRSGLSYSGVLLTRRIMSVKPLAELLDSSCLNESDWMEIGCCIRRFHNAGVIHPDLNARNILIGEQGSGKTGVYLVDFDRAFFRPGAKRLFLSNLDRLFRSLNKLWPASSVRELEPCWQLLTKGYMSSQIR